MKESNQVKSNELSIALPEGPLLAESCRMADYWELTKPRLTFLVLVTTLIGFCMGSQGSLDWIRLFHAVFGTYLVAAGAAALNQFLERDFDSRMKRTEDRPIPAGRLPSEAALLFGASLCVLGLLYLVWMVNLLTGFLGGLTLSSYLFVYTPLKRKTPLCTLVGAVPGAIPPMMGWSAATHTLASGAWVLFIILFLWQMPHFYALAQLYRDDYEKGGFPMLSVVDPSGVRVGIQIVTHTMALIPVSVMPTFLGLTGAIYFWGALFLGLIFLGFGFCAAFLRTDKASRMLFVASIFYLPFLLIFMVTTKLLR